MRILHLSDTHLPRERGADGDGIDARAALEGLLHDCRHLDIDVVVVSGDVADDGSVEGYRDARALIDTFARSKDAAQVFCVGNHDYREPFQSVLGTGHTDRTGSATGESLLPRGCCAAVSEIDGLRLITLDSLVPGQVHGELADDQLSALGELLRQPSERGSVVILHHPPIAVDTSFWRSVNLVSPDWLADVLSGSDVRAVLCGHNHLQLTGFLSGIPIWSPRG